MRSSWASVGVVGLLLASLIAGLTVYRDYGASWDEREYYEYATSIRYAYDLEDHLDQDFRIDDAYGPNSPWQKFYSPAYLLLAGSLVELLRGAIPGSDFDLWHLVNFLTFLVGGVCLFGLARRWMSPLAALGAMLLYLLQPVLWGHAFINPKDIPFTTFFIAAVLAGYIMVDATVLDQPLAAQAAPGSGWFSSWRRSTSHLRLLLGLGVALVLLILCKDLILALVERLVRFSYANPESLFGEVFRSISPRVDVLSVEAYLRKASILALRGRLVLLCGTAAGLVVGGWAYLPATSRRLAVSTIAAGMMLGLVTSIRVIGPFAGALVALCALSRPSRRHAFVIPVYAAIAAGVTYATWPYLWAAPLGNYLHAIQGMAAVPSILGVLVLYGGRVISSESLPFDYLPRLMLLTLTEPAIILATLGGIGLARHRLARSAPATALLPIVLWFALPLGYVVVTSQQMFDQYRHFLFILPPVFILAGLGLDWIFDHARLSWMKSIILLLSLAPCALGIIQLHPYEYAYFNTASGGMAAASRHYETDYWLTCYREAMSSPDLLGSSTVFVFPEPSLAALYARPGTSVQGYDPDAPPAVTPADAALLLTTRANIDLSIQPGSPVLLEVSRFGAPFCVVKSLNPALDSQGD
ncbi:MAG: hypothetical protein NTU91_12075 [Chloroflexi bacterium]|nr:hypothetical protein [Chloroflexota bacterium]